jgi:SagB-type dehydrogenase family enzyme
MTEPVGVAEELPGSVHRVEAGAMLSAIQFDPQMQGPVRPALVRGLVIVPLADGLLVEGSGERQVFRGRSATSLLPRLLTLLTGELDLDRLTTALPDVSADSIRAALALLQTTGLLEEGAAAPGDTATIPATFPEPVSSFVGRHLDTTRVHANTAKAVASIAATTVGVVGMSTAAKAVAAELAESGLQVRHVVAPGFHGGATPEVAGLDLVLAVCDGSETVDLATLDDECARQGIPWLRVARVADRLEIGPRFDRTFTACYRCFRAGRGDDPAPVDAPYEGVWPSLAAHNVFLLMSRIGTATTLIPCGVTCVDLAGWQTGVELTVRRPGCRTCVARDSSAVTAEDADEVPLAYAYEQAVSFPPRELLDPKGHQAHYRMSNLALQRLHRTYTSVARVALPEHGMEGLEKVRSAESGLSVSQLAVVLLGAFGLKAGTHDPRPYRFPPTGGNLGSSQAYVAVRNVAGLEAGVYFYEAFEHELSKVRDGLPALDLAEGADAADAVVILTSAVLRIAKKYQVSSLRICGLDAGVALWQIRTVADAVGVDCGLAESWSDESVSRLVGESHLAEPVMGIALLRSKGESS